MLVLRHDYYYQLSKEERAPYEEMANWSMEHYLDVKKDFRRDMKTIRALAEAMLPNKLEKIIDCSADNLEDHYSIGNMIGEGRFSKVYAGGRARARSRRSCRTR